MGWSTWLRPDAFKVFIGITDDNSDTTETVFESQLLAKTPKMFGTAGEPQLRRGTDRGSQGETIRRPRPGGRWIRFRPRSARAAAAPTTARSPAPEHRHRRTPLPDLRVQQLRRRCSPTSPWALSTGQGRPRLPDADAAAGRGDRPRVGGAGIHADGDRRRADVTQVKSAASVPPMRLPEQRPIYIVPMARDVIQGDTTKAKIDVELRLPQRHRLNSPRRGIPLRRRFCFSGSGAVLDQEPGDAQIRLAAQLPHQAVKLPPGRAAAAAVGRRRVSVNTDSRALCSQRAAVAQWIWNITPSLSMFVPSTRCSRRRLRCSLVKLRQRGGERPPKLSLVAVAQVDGSDLRSPPSPAHRRRYHHQRLSLRWRKATARCASPLPAASRAALLAGELADLWRDPSPC